MKKMLSICLGVFIAIFLWGISNILFAQNDPEQGLNLSEDCIMWVWQDCYKQERILWIADDQPDGGYTATSIAQDAVVAATYYVWTVLTIVLLVCWLWYVFASWSGKDTSKYKKWLIAAGIWAVLVRSAPAIVRLIQYIARW